MSTSKETADDKSFSDSSNSQKLLRTRSSGSTSSGSSCSNQYHNFQLTTFSQPTYCDLCSNFMWGLVKQGHTCLDCGYNAHKKCVVLVMTPCTHESRTVPKSVTNQVEAVTRSTSPLKKESSIITELLAETQNQSRLISNVLQEANPDLNMSVFMKQNNRFTGRQGPIIWLNQTVIKLVTWHSTTNTLIFLLCYIIICLHPIIISILPQITILCLMMKFYHRRADQIMNNKSITKPHEIGTPPKVSPSAAELKAALQNIQNTK